MRHIQSLLTGNEIRHLGKPVNSNDDVPSSPDGYQYGNPPYEALHPSRWAFDETRAKVRQSNPRSPSLSRREITLPPGFSTIPITTTMFSVTTPENTPMAYRASTSANPNSVIRPTFIKANYEALESLLRDRRRHMHNNDLRTELEYFSEDYDKEREMEPRPKPTRAATPPPRVASPKICRRGERTLGFEGAQSRGESRVERNTEGERPLEEAPRGNGGQSVNLPPLLAPIWGEARMDNLFNLL
ncbi:hypothetical protein Tco_1167627 [Tanacetum coccineum]